MDQSGNAAEASTRQGRSWRVIWYGVLLPLAGAVLMTRDSPASEPGYGRVLFLRQYAHGIYRYRVLGREAVLGLGWVLHGIVPALAPNGPYGYSLFWAWSIVNGLALVAVSLLLYFTTARSPRWARAYGLMVLGMVFGAINPTPYDFLSYVLVGAAVILAVSDWKWRAAGCFALSVLGVLTRESFFVAVAAVVALAITAEPARRRQLLAPAWALGLGSVGTYIGLRLFIPGGPLFMQNGWLAANWHLAAIAGCVGAGVVVAVVYWALSYTLSGTGPTRHRYHRATLVTWVLCVPYLAVSFVSGLWNESPRLIMPVLLVGYLVAWSVSRDGGGVPEPEALIDATGCA